MYRSLRSNKLCGVDCYYCIPPKMKQGGKKRPAKTGKYVEYGDSCLSDECRPAKQRKMAHRDGKSGEAKTNENGKRWTSVETDVEPEILEEMGVKILGDEENCCLQENTKSVLQDSKSPVTLQPLTESNSSETRLPPSKRDQRCQNDLNEEFFLFRRKQPVQVKGEDVFSKLSDEIVLMIFRMLPKTMLVRCSLVCKRWQRIAYDEALWIKMDLGSKTLPPGSLGHLLVRKTVILRLAQAEISDPVFFSSCALLSNNVSTKLQYLDLSMSVITEEGLASLICVCSNLRKLSLEHCSVNEKVCLALGHNSSMEVLNMSACYGITRDCLTYILDGCRQLHALNLAWTNLSVESLDTLCTDLPSSMQRINISGCRKTLTDDHVEQLVASCPELVELDLSDCTTLTARTLEIVSGLTKIEYLALSRCYSIVPSAYTKLRSIKTLMYLDVFNLMNEQAIANLQQNLPGVEVNKFLFSSVARPTVGIRRTSIWGLRVRD